VNEALWKDSPLYLSVKSMLDSLHRWRRFRRRRDDLAYRMLGVLRDLLLTLEIRDRRIEELERQITLLVNKGSRGCVGKATETSR
jgi:hypothetical protein